MQGAGPYVELAAAAMRGGRAGAMHPRLKMPSGQGRSRGEAWGAHARGGAGVGWQQQLGEGAALGLCAHDSRCPQAKGAAGARHGMHMQGAGLWLAGSSSRARGLY